MSENVQFDSDKYNRPTSISNQESGMIGWLLKHKIVTSKNAANILLLVVFAVVVAITIFVLKTY